MEILQKGVYFRRLSHAPYTVISETPTYYSCNCLVLRITAFFSGNFQDSDGNYINVEKNSLFTYLKNCAKLLNGILLSKANNYVINILKNKKIYIYIMIIHINSSEASPTIWTCYANLNHYHYSFL